jgi:molybdopterin-binding protein
MLAQSPVPVMLVTHDREEALALGDSVQVINEGRTLVTGEPLDVLGQPGQGRIARLVGVENLFDLTIQERNPRDGTMTCVGPGLRLEVPLDSQISESGTPDGGQDRVTVGIRASDIILAKEDLSGSSARNRLPGQVVSVEPRPPGYAVTLDCGQPMRCHITGAALEEMGIQPGQRLWAVFKASSCFLVDQNRV